MLLELQVHAIHAIHAVHSVHAARTWCTWLVYMLYTFAQIIPIYYLLIVIWKALELLFINLELNLKIIKKSSIAKFIYLSAKVYKTKIVRNMIKTILKSPLSNKFKYIKILPIYKQISQFHLWFVKELSRCHKLKFSYCNIFATQCCRPLIF